MLRLENDRPDIPVDEMKDGDIAEIVESSNVEYLRRIVQRCGLDLITLGAEDNKSWVSFFPASTTTSSFHVRILGPGTKFVL